MQFRPKYQPASGSVIKIRLIYQKNGNSVEVPAQQWVRDSKTKKDLAQDWVFGGSFHSRSARTRHKALLRGQRRRRDLRLQFRDGPARFADRKLKNNDDLSFEANTEATAARSAVMVVLEPVAKKK